MVLDRTNVRELTPERRRRRGRPGRGATSPSSPSAWCCPPCGAPWTRSRLRADGQAAVRGRSRAARLRRCRARAGAAGRSRCVRSPRRRRWPRAGGCRRHGQPASGPVRATSSTSCGCGRVRLSSTSRQLRRAIAGGPRMSEGSQRRRGPSCSSPTPDATRRRQAAAAQLAERLLASRSFACASRARRPGELEPRGRRGRAARGRGCRRTASSWSCSAATARCCARPSSPRHRAPCSGSTSGHVGFLAEAEHDDLAATVDAARRAATTRSRSASPSTSRSCVDGELSRPALGRSTRPASRSRPRADARGGRRGRRPAAVAVGRDGVVCATPTGSTAYAFSAGGPVVWPEVEALLLVPISAHALFARPLVVAPYLGARRRGLPSRRRAGSCGATADGTVELRRCPGRGAPRQRAGPAGPAHHAPFTDRLVAKFGLPVEGWRGAPSARRRRGRACSRRSASRDSA